MFTSQSSPLYPAGHSHVKLATPSRHISAVSAGSVSAVVDVYLAEIPLVARWAFTSEARHAVNTLSAVSTGSVSAVVDVYLAEIPLVAR